MSATVTRAEPQRPKPTEVRIPRLQTGDHLSVAEFERRYAAMPEVKKAELIDGVVYMPMPVSFDDHGASFHLIAGWGLWFATPGPRRRQRDAAPSRRPSPAARRIPPHPSGVRGQSRTDDERFRRGIGHEIAASSATYDLHKLDAYR